MEQLQYSVHTECEIQSGDSANGIGLIDDVCNISVSDLKKRRGIRPGNKIASFNLKPIFFKFSVEFVTVMPAGNNNGTPFKRRPKRGNDRGTR